MSLVQSYELIGRVLASLTLAGLRSQTLKPENFGVEDRGGLLHFMDVVNWLQNEGLLTAGNPQINGSYPRAQLTSRGIAAVESGSFNNAGVSVRATVEAKPDGSLGADTYSKIGSFVGGLLGGFAQSVS